MKFQETVTNSLLRNDGISIEKIDQALKSQYQKLIGLNGTHCFTQNAKNATMFFQSPWVNFNHQRLPAVQWKKAIV
jgi:hypothetical protein